MLLDYENVEIFNLYLDPTLAEMEKMTQASQPPERKFGGDLKALAEGFNKLKSLPIQESSLTFDNSSYLVFDFAKRTSNGKPSLKFIKDL